MDTSAQNKSLGTKKHQVLITDVTSFLGYSLAKSLISENCAVFGIAASAQATLQSGFPSLLKKPDFTLLELDLNQPLPSYLPDFDLIFYFLPDSIPQASFSPTFSNIFSYAQAINSKIFVFAPVKRGSQFYDYLVDDKTKKFLRLFLVGDIYGPGMQLGTNDKNTLANLISQAQESDKVILENEGLDMIYPAYITDVIFAINKIVFENLPKNVHFLISESPKTALAVAYEIQNVASRILDKQLGLFFGGEEKTFTHGPEVVVQKQDLGYIPRVHLEEGLKKTFEYFKEHNIYKKPEEKSIPPQPFFLKLEPQPTAQKSDLKSKILDKIPKNGHFRFQNILILLSVIIFLFIGKTIFDIAWATIKLASAQTFISSGEFQKAKSASKSAQKFYASAKNKTKVILYPVSFIFPQTSSHIVLTLDALSQGAGAVEDFIDGFQVLTLTLSQISASTKNEKIDLETPSANFKKATSQAAFAAQALKSTASSLPFSSNFKKAQEVFTNLNHIAAIAHESANLIEDFTGAGAKRTYLVLLQNNTELRPGGGFIGNFAEITFDEGKLKNVSVEDIYTIDGQLKEKIEPPVELKAKLGVDRLYLRDSNWSPDSTLNAKTARDFYKKETGKDVDGVFTIDLTLVQNLLAKIGPVTLNDYNNEEITAENIFEKGESHEIGFFPGSTAKRDFFGSLQRALIAKILSSQASSWPAIFQVVKDGLSQKHIILAFDNPILGTYVATHHWDNPFPPTYFNPADDATETRDFLALSEANLGANKVNRVLERKIAYEMTIGRDADLVAKVTITYKNNSQAETWPAGKYVNFLRVYAPFAASLFEHKQSLRSSDDPAGLKNGDKQDLKDVTITTQGNLTVFSTFVEVPVKSEKVVSFTYRIPKNIKLEKAPYYHLYIQKQPGTEKDPLEFKFNLPGYLLVKSVNQDQSQSGSPRVEAGTQNLTANTDLATDRQFEIELAKK
ncbi:DUF4012 domain-containing protein [Candidatus Curtissbacteria bacterium]|nr:DUF4012 domain-containing protein [Candidatus Curtissbacteria bacterium]